MTDNDATDPLAARLAAERDRLHQDPTEQEIARSRRDLARINTAAAAQSDAEADQAVRELLGHDPFDTAIPPGGARLTWHGTVGYINTPTRDGRALLADPAAPLRTVPMPLLLNLITAQHDAQDVISVGSVLSAHVHGTAIIADGLIDLPAPGSTAWADRLHAGESVPVGLDVAGLADPDNLDGKWVLFGTAHARAADSRPVMVTAPRVRAPTAADLAYLTAAQLAQVRQVLDDWVVMRLNVYDGLDPAWPTACISLEGAA